ncbi:hypothetical protein QFZ33_000707 [Arthrobacter globiformis]|nr:hypothetical protein [Arthrobacter globiformis]
MTHTNEMPVHNEPHVPFGGEGNFGLGRFNGDRAIAEFTTDHAVGPSASEAYRPAAAQHACCGGAMAYATSTSTKLVRIGTNSVWISGVDPWVAHRANR